MNETRMYADLVKSSKMLIPGLMASSRSAQDAKNREKVYQQVFSNYEGLKGIIKAFSGQAENQLLTNQFFNATVASYVQSFAGYIAIERSMDQPNALMGFMDILGVTDNRKVLPNIGTENLANINNRIVSSATLVGGVTNIALGKKIVPGSLKVTFVDSSAALSVEAVDDRKGALIAASTVLSTGTINYLTGALSFTLGAIFTPAAGDTYTVTATEDVTGTPDFGGTPNGHNRFKTDLQYIRVDTLPDMLIGESNLVAMAAMQKSTGIDPLAMLGQKLTELFTKVINGNMVNSLLANYAGSTEAIDMATMAPSYNDYRSSIDYFSSKLIDVDTVLATKSVKGVKATAYLVGTEMGNYFRKAKLIGMFVDNKGTNYVNDLIGTYDGIPVLQHTSIDSKTGFAVHKTIGGELAPLMRGIFLPLTNTPTVGNYNNPTQVANGVFYQEAQQSIVPELVQKFTVS